MKKSAVISALLILLIITIGIVSCALALSGTNDVTDLVKALPDKRSPLVNSEVEKISNKWDKVKIYLSLVVKNDYLTNAELALCTLRECAERGTDCEYLCAKGAFLVSLDSISSSCGISLEAFL